MVVFRHNFTFIIYLCKWSSADMHETQTVPDRRFATLVYRQM